MPVRRRLGIVAVAFVLTGCTADEVPTPVRPLSTPQGPSQTEAEAKRDGVPKEIAALTLDERTRLDDLPDPYGPSSITTDEGVWRLSRPGPLEYGEVLLLDARRERVIKAFPLEWPPYVLAVTDDAVYCGRTGDGALPNTTICRIDRRTQELTGRIFGCEGLPDCPPIADPARGWSVSEASLDIYEFVADDGALWCKSYKKDWTRLDPDTLEILERGTKGPSAATS